VVLEALEISGTAEVTISAGDHLVNVELLLGLSSTNKLL